MPQLYDLMVLIDPDAPTERRAEILRDVESAIGSGGSLESRHDWGARRMAYEIDHRGEADYHLLQFTAGRELLESLQRTLKLTDGIIRFRIIKVRRGTPPPPTVRSEAPAPDAERPRDAEPAEAAPAEPPPAEAPPAEAPPAEAPPAEAPPAEAPPAA